MLLDTGQQNEAYFNLSVNIASELFDTIRVNDSVNVVSFNAAEAILSQPSSVGFHFTFTVVSSVLLLAVVFSFFWKGGASL